MKLLTALIKDPLKCSARVKPYDFTMNVQRDNTPNKTVSTTYFIADIGFIAKFIKRKLKYL